MATAVFFRLNEGSLVRFGRTRDSVAAAKVKRSVEDWARDGVTVSVANAKGELVEVNLKNVVAVELADEPTPPTGSRMVLDPPRG